MKKPAHIFKIQTSHLSIRTKNILGRADILTLEELTEYSVKSLGRVRGIGKESVCEILEELNSNNLVLKEN